MEDLSEKERAVINLFFRDFYTPKKISCRLKISLRHVYRIINKLKKKGSFFEPKNIGMSGGGVTNGLIMSLTPPLDVEPTKYSLRLHNEQYHILPHVKGKRWSKLIGKKISVQGNSVVVYPDVLEVYSNISFFGSTTGDVERLSSSYWAKFFRILEFRLGCVLLKDDSEAVKRVRADWAEINNEFAAKARKDREKLEFRDDSDGKTWLKADFSNKVPELECVHPLSGKKDMDAIKPFMETLRANPNVLGELVGLVKQVLELQVVQANLNKETAAGLTAVVSFLKAGLPDVSINDKTEKDIKEDRPSYVG